MKNPIHSYLAPLWATLTCRIIIVVLHSCFCRFRLSGSPKRQIPGKWEAETSWPKHNSSPIGLHAAVAKQVKLLKSLWAHPKQNGAAELLNIAYAKFL